MLGGLFARRSFGWIFILAVVYGVFVLALGAMQKNFLYYPDPTKFVPSEWALKELKPLEVKTEDGLSITSWYNPPRKLGKFTVVFFQGNSGHLGYRNYKVRPWIDAGYGVLMVGYRGFGNPGVPSEAGLYDDARAAIDALHARGTPDKGFVFYGESMGTGVATQMATEYEASGLILESPYSSVSDVGASRFPLVPVHWLLKGQYNSIGKIKDVHMPLLIMHGEIDNVVPVKFGKMLFAAANEPKQAEWIPDVGHYGVYNLRMQQLVLNFIGKLPNDTLLQGIGGGGNRKGADKEPEVKEGDTIRKDAAP